jgi:hypothetical protein
MSKATDILSETTPAQEVADTELGDKRRTDRYIHVVDALSRRPDRSIPEALEDEAAQEGYYRFIRNPNVESEALLEPHIKATARRAEHLSHVLCIHDTTEFAWKVRDDHMRKHLARLSSKRQGFKWHSSIVTSADGTRAPLGTVAAQPFVHEGDCPDEETVEEWEERGGIFDNEKWRWFQGVGQSEAQLEQVDRVTHVMDREGDDFEMIFCMVAEGYDFLVRMRTERNVCTGDRRADYESIKEALADQPWRGHRQVELSARPASKASKSHPVRRARTAKLRVRAASVEIRRPDNVKAAKAPDRLELNVVQVREVNAPAGEEPVEWLLITTHEVETADQIWQVVDWYRGRWVTEEFYKAIKTGCGYTDLQHRSAKTLLCALAACTVVAHHLLALRYLGRNAEDLPAEAVVTDVQLKVLRATKEKYIGDDPTAGEAMTAVAKLGGHISSNGEPGWQVLGRGWQRLLEYEHAFALGMQAQQEM